MYNDMQKGIKATRGRQQTHPLLPMRQCKGEPIFHRLVRPNQEFAVSPSNQAVCSYDAEAYGPPNIHRSNLHLAITIGAEKHKHVGPRATATFYRSWNMWVRYGYDCI